MVDCYLISINLFITSVRLYTFIRPNLAINKLPRFLNRTRTNGSYLMCDVMYVTTNTVCQRLST